jgi:hypothetical protein
MTTKMIEVLCHVLEGTEAGYPMVVEFDPTTEDDLLSIYAVGTIWTNTKDPRCTKFEVLRHREKLSTLGLDQV